MRKKNYKGRCEKRRLPKFEDVCRTYDEIQYACADVLSEIEEVKSIRCNVVLDGFSEGDYMTDFVCIKENGDLMVRECVHRRHISKPKTAKLLEESRKYWQRRGVDDWGIVIEKEEDDNEQT